MSNRTCPVCSGEVVGSANRVYCSATCSNRAKENAKKANGYYKRAEVKARQAAYKREKYREDVSVGKESGSRLEGWSAAGVAGMSDLASIEHCAVDGCERKLHALVRCSSHYHAYMRDQGKPWAEEYFAPGNDGRIRAKKYGVLFERFSKVDVFDRDGYVCGICDDPVDRSLKYPDPMSVSLDHVVPLSRGGGHLFENSQCSHLICNIRKGARVGESRVLAGSS